MNEERRASRLRTLSADTTGELNVLGHDGDTLGCRNQARRERQKIVSNTPLMNHQPSQQHNNKRTVNGTQVGVLKESNQVSLSSLLQSKDGRSLETQVVLEILSNLTNKTLERKLADQEVRRLLVTTNLTKSDSS
jgi:hypothetical protein